MRNRFRAAAALIATLKTAAPGLWGRNPGNKTSLANAIRIDIVGGTTSGFLAAPRIFGVSIGYRLP
jgi:hypothetical protein